MPRTGMRQTRIQQPAERSSFWVSLHVSESWNKVFMLLGRFCKSSLFVCLFYSYTVPGLKGPCGMAS
jgi:hypothetical protein